MAVVLCGVLINGVGLVVSLDYRKLGVQMPVQVGLNSSFRAISCMLLSHIHFIHARVYHYYFTFLT